MSKTIAIILMILVSLASKGQKKIAGEYQTNSSSFGGVFSEVLTINCDSSAVLNSRTDIMNATHYGKWRIGNNRLIINYDSVPTIENRPISMMVLRIKGKKLIWKSGHFYKRTKAFDCELSKAK
jgi:hypothetical protein